MKLLFYIIFFIILIKFFSIIKKERYLVFSSVGDNTNFDKLWLNGNKIFDIWVIYYGDNDANYLRYKSKVDFIEKRKGSKFQNFYYL